MFVELGATAPLFLYRLIFGLRHLCVVGAVAMCAFNTAHGQTSTDELTAEIVDAKAETAAALDDGREAIPSINRPGDGAPTVSWIRTYVEGDIDENAAVDFPEYYQSALEQDVRRNLRSQLLTRGVTIVDDAEALHRISFSVDVKTPGARGAKRSALQIAPDFTQNDRADQTRIDPISNPGFRPVITFGPRSKGLDAGPSVRVSIHLVKASERVWSGYAEAPLGNQSRRAVANDLISALVANWGQTASLDQDSIE